MEYFYLFLVVILSLNLIVFKAWHLRLDKINNWQHYQVEQSKLNNHKSILKQCLLDSYAELRSLQIIVLIAINCLLIVLISNLVKIWWAAVVLVLINLTTNLLAKLKSIDDLVYRNFIKHQIIIIKISRICSKISLKSLSLPQIDSPKLESYQHFQFLINNTNLIDLETKNQLLNIYDLPKHKITNLYHQLKQYGRINLDQELTPLELDQLYKINQNYAFVSDKKQIIGLVDLAKISQINNSSLGKLKDLIEPDLTRFDYQAKVNIVLKTMLNQAQTIALITKKQKIIGLIRLQDITKSLKIS